MSLRSIRVVYLKELRDLLRDRRTIISMIVVPVLVIPLLMLGIGGISVKMVRKAAEEVPAVMILGETNAPALAAQLRGLPRLNVVPADPDYTNLISNKKVRAAVEIPPGFDAALAAGEPAVVRIYEYQGEIKSQFGVNALRDFFHDLRQTTVSNRLASHNLPPSLIRPFEIEQTNVAPPQKVSGNLIGGLIPYIIILMSLTGAMYPAMDLTAGEKERGTIETLLCSPASRGSLVLGKFLMVLTAAVATTVLSLSSMGGSFLVASRLVSRAGGEAAARLPLTVDLPSLLLVFLMMLPVAVMFSALLLALALFARSFKEAQSYVSPLMIVVIMPAVASMVPGVELDALLSIVPVLNVSLVSKEILSGTLHWGHLGLIFLSSSVYAAAALGFAVWQFQRESVLFRS
jgi:sodium transport system permease protein